MTSRHVELALKKQRLQFESAALRRQLRADIAGIAPVFRAGDAMMSGLLWLRGHGEWVVGIAAVLAVTRPRRLLRWARRGFMAWQAWRRLGRWLQRPPSRDLI